VLFTEESFGFAASVLKGGDFIQLTQDYTKSGDVTDPLIPRWPDMMRLDVVGQHLQVNKSFPNEDRGRLAFCEIHILGGKDTGGILFV